MKTATSLPAPMMLVVLIATMSIGKSSPPEGVRQFGALLLVALPVLAILAVAACGYDFVKTKDKIFSAAFAPRLAMHVAGCSVALWILALTAKFVSLGPINPG